MAQGALSSKRGDPAAAVELAGQAEHGIELEKRERRGGIVEVDLARFDLRFHLVRQGVRIHLEADRERSLRADTRSHPAVCRARYRPVQLERAAEESLRAVGVEAEDLPTPFHHVFRVCGDLAVNPGKPFQAFLPVPLPLVVPVSRFLRLRISLLSDARSESYEHGKRDDGNTDDRSKHFKSHANSSNHSRGVRSLRTLR